MIYNHKLSVQVVEKEDINGVVIDENVSRMSGEKVIDSPPTLCFAIGISYDDGSYVNSFASRCRSELE